MRTDSRHVEDRAERRFAAVLGLGRGTGAAHAHVAGVGDVVREALARNAHPDELRLFSSPAHRWVAVLILDDDTQTYREAHSFAARDEALGAPADPVRVEQGLIGEYVIDLDGPDLGACCFPVLDDGTLAPSAVPFDERHVAFA